MSLENYNKFGIKDTPSIWSGISIPAASRIVGARSYNFAKPEDIYPFLKPGPDMARGILMLSS